MIKRTLCILAASFFFSSAAFAALYGTATVLTAGNGQQYVQIDCFDVDGGNSTYVGTVNVSINSPTGANGTCRAMFGLIVGGDDDDIIAVTQDERIDLDLGLGDPAPIDTTPVFEEEETEIEEDSILSE